MLDPIHDSNFQEVEWADSFNACDIDPELAGIRAALVMGVDSAGLAEIVLRRSTVELIERQLTFAL